MQPDKKHEWTAIFTVSLTDKEADIAYLDRNGAYNVMAKKITVEEVGKHGGVDVGCFVCEQPYQLIHDNPCVPDNSIKSQL